jgi:hypothetical protein
MEDTFVKSKKSFQFFSIVLKSARTTFQVDADESWARGTGYLEGRGELAIIDGDKGHTGYFTSLPPSQKFIYERPEIVCMLRLGPSVVFPETR